MPMTPIVVIVWHLLPTHPRRLLVSVRNEELPNLRHLRKHVFHGVHCVVVLVVRNVYTLAACVRLPKVSSKLIRQPSQRHVVIETYRRRRTRYRMHNTLVHRKILLNFSNTVRNVVIPAPHRNAKIAEHSVNAFTDCSSSHSLTSKYTRIAVSAFKLAMITSPLLTDGFDSIRLLFDSKLFLIEAIDNDHLHRWGNECEQVARRLCLTVVVSLNPCRLVAISPVFF